MRKNQSANGKTMRSDPALQRTDGEAAATPQTAAGFSAQVRLTFLMVYREVTIEMTDMKTMAAA